MQTYFVTAMLFPYLKNTMSHLISVILLFIPLFHFDNLSTRSLTIKDLGAVATSFDNIAVAKSEFPEAKLILMLSKKGSQNF